MITNGTEAGGMGFTGILIPASVTSRSVDLA